MVQVAEIETKFDNRFTREFGFPKGRAATKVVDFLEDKTREFIRQSPFMVMATSSADGTCDASPKGGKPGLGEDSGRPDAADPGRGGEQVVPVVSEHGG